MNDKTITAHLNDVLFFRLLESQLQSHRDFLFSKINTNLYQHLEFINIRPKNILNICIDNNKLNFKGSKIEKFFPINKPSRFSLFSKEKYANINAIQDIYTQKFDLIYSNLSLTYFNNLDIILKNLSNMLSEQGIILFSVFGIGSGVELPFKLPLLDMHDIGDIANRIFENPVIDAQRLNLDYKESDIALINKDLEAFGIFKNIGTKINSLSIEVVYLHAWKRKDYSVIEFKKK